MEGHVFYGFSTCLSETPTCCPSGPDRLGEEDTAAGVLGLLEPADLEIHAREKRERRGNVFIAMHKEDWNPQKHEKPIQYGQISTTFGTDVTNTAPTYGKDTRGYRIRGSKIVAFAMWL